MKITDLTEFIDNGGLTIKFRNGEYQIFTVPTQHFTVKSLDELTLERFEYISKLQSEMNDGMFKSIENEINDEILNQLRT